jgi:hypothetical protein
MVALLCDSDTQTIRMRELLVQEKLEDLQVETLNLSEGFQWPAQHLYLSPTIEPRKVAPPCRIWVN